VLALYICVIKPLRAATAYPETLEAQEENGRRGIEQVKGEGSNCELEEITAYATVHLDL
jgi:hypothetical protein